MVDTATATRPVAIPAIVWGRRAVTAGAGGRQLAGTEIVDEAVTWDTSCGAPFEHPRVLRSPLGDAGAARARDLAGVPLSEIGAFLYRVGRQWEQREYPRRQLFELGLQRVMGLSPEMAVFEANLVAVLLRSRGRWLEALEAELGSWRALDRWVESGDSTVRAIPVGSVLHLLPGTVPAAGVMSIVRAILTKNISIVKPAVDDPVTATSLALSFMDSDPDHPVTRSLSVLYWPHDDPVGDEIAAEVDAIVAWGGDHAIEWARRRAGVDTRVLAFGPKSSIAIVGKGADLGVVGDRLAHDVSMYEQRGCFSVRQVFLEDDDPESLIAALADGLRHYASLLPPARRTDDEAAMAAIAGIEALVLGERVTADSANAWQIIVRAPEDVRESPFARTVFIHPGWPPEQVARHWVSPRTQTVMVEPWEVALDVRDVLAAAGVSRIAEAGQSNLPRTGGAHDGIRPLAALLRFVTCDPSSTELGKGLVAPLNQTRLLEEPVFAERFTHFAP